MNKKVFSVVAATLAAILLFASPLGIALAQSGGETFATGFNSPQGVLVDSEGNVWVADSGMGGDQQMTLTPADGSDQATLTFGNSGRIVRIAPDGSQTVASQVPSLTTPEGIEGAARLALLNGTLYATSSGWQQGIDADRPDMAGSVVKVEDGSLTEVANLWAFEQSKNPDGRQLDSHPYGIAANPGDGSLWVTDAGANDLLRVDPESGDVSLIKAFDMLPSGIPAGQGPPEAEPVPTGIAFGPDGTAYVAFLPGFPFTPGSAKVVTVTPDGKVSDYATGLTGITDLATGPDGALYAVSIGQIGAQGISPNAGMVLRIKQGTDSQVVVDGLPFATSISFDGDGNAYVTTGGVGAPGSGAVMRFAGLTDMAGSPLPAPQSPETATPQALPVTGGTPLPSGWLLAGLGAIVVAASLVLRASQRPAAPEEIRHE